MRNECGNRTALGWNVWHTRAASGRERACAVGRCHCAHTPRPAARPLRPQALRPHARGDPRPRHGAPRAPAPPHRVSANRYSPPRPAPRSRPRRPRALRPSTRYVTAEGGEVASPARQHPRPAPAASGASRGAWCVSARQSDTYVRERRAVFRVQRGRATPETHENVAEIGVFPARR